MMEGTMARELITKTCEWCGSTFETTNNYRHYCSKECYRKGNRHKSGKTMMECEVCKKPFYGWRSRLYCSKECRLIGLKRVRRQKVEQKTEKKKTMPNMYGLDFEKLQPTPYYICPRCKKQHNEGLLYRLSKWQYCKACRARINEYDEDWIAYG